MPDPAYCYESSDKTYRSVKKNADKTYDLSKTHDINEIKKQSSDSKTIYYYPDCGRFKAFPEASKAAVIQLKQNQIDELFGLIEQLTTTLDVSDTVHGLTDIGDHLNTLKGHIEMYKSDTDEKVDKIIETNINNELNNNIKPKLTILSDRLKGWKAQMDDLKSRPDILSLTNEINTLTADLQNKNAHIQQLISAHNGDIQQKDAERKALIDAHNEEIKVLETQAAGYINDINDLKQEIATKQNQIDILNQQVADLTASQAPSDQLNILNNQIDTLQSQVQTLQQAVNVKQQDIGDLQQSLISKDQEINKLTSSVDSQKQQTNWTEGSLRQDIDDLHTEIDSKTAELQQLSAEKTIVEQNLNAVTKTLQDIQQKESEHLSTIQQLTQQNESLQQVIAKVTEQKQEVEQTLRGLQTSQSSEQTRLQEIIKELQPKISLYQDQLNALRQQEQQWKNEKQTLDNTISTLTEERTNLIAEREQLKQQGDTNTDGLNTLKARILKIDLKRKQVDSAKQDIETKLKQIEKYIEETSETINEKQQQIDEQQQKINEQQNKIKEQEQQVQALTKTIADKEQQINNINEAHKKEREELEKSTTFSASKLQKEYNELVEKYTNIDLKKKEIENQVHNLQEENRKLRENLDKKLVSETQFNKQKEELEELPKLRTSNSELQELYNKLSEEHNTLKQQLSNLTNDRDNVISGLHKQLDQLKAENENLKTQLTANQQSNNRINELEQQLGSLQAPASAHQECNEKPLQCIEKIAKQILGKSDQVSVHFKLSFQSLKKSIEALQLFASARLISTNDQIIGVKIVHANNNKFVISDLIAMSPSVKENELRLYPFSTENQIELKPLKIDTKTIRQDEQMYLSFLNSIPESFVTKQLGSANLITSVSSEFATIRQFWKDVDLEANIVTYTPSQDVTETIDAIRRELAPAQVTIDSVKAFLQRQKQENEQELKNTLKQLLQDLQIDLREIQQPLPSFDLEKCKENQYYNKEQGKQLLTLLNAKDSIIKQFQNKIDLLDTKSVSKELKSSYASRKKEIQTEYTRLKERIETFSNVYDSDELDLEKCKILAEHRRLYQDEQRNIESLFNIISDLSEDLLGAVRVYIRARDINSEEESERERFIAYNGKSVDFTEKDGNVTRFGPFSGVYPDGLTIADVYNGSKIVDEKTKQKINNENAPALRNTIRQVLSGYSIILFGYGLSGSGKTFSILGQSANNIFSKGILSFAIQDLLSQSNVVSIKLKHLFEEYYLEVNPTAITLLPKMIIYKSQTLKELIKAQFLKIGYNPDKHFNADNSLKDQIITFNSSIESRKDIDTSIDTFLKVLEAERLAKGRIKQTPNNKKSSRSHLYMVFEIKLKSSDGSESSGFLTFVDMAGREDPLAIRKYYYKPTIGLKGQDIHIDIGSLLSYENSISTPVQYNKFIKEAFIDKLKGEYIKTTDAENQTFLKELVTIFKEGFYINESINQLTYYFKKKLNSSYSIRDTKNKPTVLASFTADFVKNYNPSLNVTTPDTTQSLYEGKELTTSILSKGVWTFTIPILKFLDTGLQGVQNKPTKFVMMCNIRQTKPNKEQTRKTLEFAESIKSI